MKSFEGKAERPFAKLQGKDILARVAEIDPSVEVRSAMNVKDNGVVMGVGDNPYFTAAAFTAPVGKIYGHLSRRARLLHHTSSQPQGSR